jgi:hypothetical protein
MTNLLALAVLFVSLFSALPVDAQGLCEAEGGTERCRPGKPVWQFNANRSPPGSSGVYASLNDAIVGATYDPGGGVQFWLGGLHSAFNYWKSGVCPVSCEVLWGTSGGELRGCTARHCV